MATTSEVKAGLDAIAQTIARERRALTQAHERIHQAFTTLYDIPTDEVYAPVLAEIDGYTPTGAFETLAQDEKARLATEFVALRNAADAANVALDAFTEF